MSKERSFGVYIVQIHGFYANVIAEFESALTHKRFDTTGWLLDGTEQLICKIKFHIAQLLLIKESVDDIYLHKYDANFCKEAIDQDFIVWICNKVQDIANSLNKEWSDYVNGKYFKKSCLPKYEKDKLNEEWNSESLIQSIRMLLEMIYEIYNV